MMRPQDRIGIDEFDYLKNRGESSGNRLRHPQENR